MHCFVLLLLEIQILNDLPNLADTNKAGWYKHSFDFYMQLNRFEY